MATFTDIAALIPTLSARLVDDCDADLARASMMLMTDAEIVGVLEETAGIAKQIEQIQLLAAGVTAARSSRESGHSGLSQSRGHRSAASFVQNITGSTKAEANRKVRVGEALLDDADDANDSAGEQDETSPSGDDPQDRPEVGPWHQPLRDALRDSRLTSAQFDAIRRGLGDPPEPGEDAPVDATDADATDADARVHAQQEAVRAAWRQAADQLINEAAERTVEELWQAARTVRDLLDPEGAEARFLARFEKRSFRTFRGQDGQKRASVILDDEGDLFLESLAAAAMRPRRGGPRFVDPDEKEQAASLVDDPRTNDQLTT